MHTHVASGSVGAALSGRVRVVTAAAAIMVVVFASFLLDPSRILQQFGLGLAVAVFLDALVIRLERAVPLGAVAGERYAPHQMTMLDSERALAR